MAEMSRFYPCYAPTPSCGCSRDGLCVGGHRHLRDEAEAEAGLGRDCDPGTPPLPGWTADATHAAYQAGGVVRQGNEVRAGEHPLLPTSRKRGVPIAGQCCASRGFRRPKLSGLTAAEVYVKYGKPRVTNSSRNRGGPKQACLAERIRAMGRGVIANVRRGNQAQADSPICTRTRVGHSAHPIVRQVDDSIRDGEATQAHGPTGGGLSRADGYFG